MASPAEGGRVRGAWDARHPVSVRLAASDDSRDIWEWRNDEATKQMSATLSGVDWEAHSAWYEQSLVNEKRFLYIGCIDAIEKIGMCRFDMDPRRRIAEVSINLNPRYRRKALSSPLLSAAIVDFLGRCNVDLIARIKKVNVGSIKCFTKSGFKFEREDVEYNYYKYGSDQSRRMSSGPDTA
jgi:RimJ/RimL family protein N-acetyltransferase